MTQKPTASMYNNPELAAWLGSFEGVPDDWDQPTSSAGIAAIDLLWPQKLHELFASGGVLAPGVVLAVLLALVGGWLSHAVGVGLLGFDKSPISAILLAVVLGIIIRNTLGVPEVYEKGLRICVKKILRVGIALLGIRLSLLAAGKIGLVALPIVLICIGAALFVVAKATRWLGLPRRLGTLIAVGTSICGVSAIVATAPSIEAEEDEISYAVATITLFGMLALCIYPFVAPWLFNHDPVLAGLFLGTAIHDTSQVAGAGLIAQQQMGADAVLNTAVVTKLVRNLCMVWVIPMMAIMYHRNDANTPNRQSSPRWTQMVPVFVLGFIGMTLLRTVGDIGERPFGLFDSAVWDRIVATTKDAAKWCLMLAMAAV